MKAITLLLLRISTGVVLMLWGIFRIQSPESGAGLGERFGYPGVLSAENMQMGIGVAETALGVAVILGLLRKISYPLQMIVLLAGALLIWKHIADPFGLFLFAEDEAPRRTFFPSLCLFVATLVMMAFKEDDTLSVDHKLGLPF